jgi:hypothetical protein
MGQSYTPVDNQLHPEVRRYFAELGRAGGRANKGSKARILASKRTAKNRWLLRRARWGETGRRQPYQIHPERYLPAHQPVTGDTGQTDKESGKDQPITASTIPSVD